MTNMLKMVLGIAIGVAILALPAMASADGPHIDPAGASFSSEEGTWTLFAGEGVLPIVCDGPNHLLGKFDEGSNTTGEINIDYTHCHTKYLEADCRTTGAPLSYTIQVTNIRFETVYTTESKTSSGLLLTLPSSLFVPAIKITCGTGTYELKGSVMGAFTAPNCMESRKTATLAFTATGNVQNQMQITGAGTYYDLQERAGGGSWRTAAVTTTTGLTFAETMTLTCI